MSDQELALAFFKGQIERLTIYSQFRFVKTEGRKAMTAWLIRTSQGDKERAESIMDAVDTWCKENKDIPEPWELDGIVKQFNPQSQPKRLASPDCPDCGGTGWMEEPVSDDYSVSSPCRCGGISAGNAARKYKGKRDTEFADDLASEYAGRLAKKL